MLKRLTRFPSSPLIIRVPFFLLGSYSVLIREPKRKKGKRVLLGHLAKNPNLASSGPATVPATARLEVSTRTQGFRA